MQQPTLTNVRIRSVQDAHRIFYAVQKGRLERIRRRLDVDERNALRSGCIYVWEQRGSHAVDVMGLGIERFTEGKKWTASRVRDEFLFYYQIKYAMALDC
ncbi:cAMP-independent regulatory protein pac2 [Termitomyces sp. J132]|nr:cAMP-independent regulatory protein pac2 [Termitomyces sp. J132]